MATTDKYDRQLRLWGATGQRRLAESCVVLVGASAAGTETLKNLVLPGVGSIVIVDDQATVSPNDVASNFFCCTETTTTTNAVNRAQVCTELLQELNPDVKAKSEFVESSLQQCDFKSLLQAASTWSQAASMEKLLVVASDLEPPILLNLSSVCETLKIPCVVVDTFGLMGFVRLQTSVAHPILEPKPRDAPPDLRLTKPFAALQQLADGIDWESLDSKDHGHVPYPLILLKIAKEYNGNLPKTFAEKQEFTKKVAAAARNLDQELNFQEAKQNAYLGYAARELDLDHLATLKTNAPAGSDMAHLLTALDAFLKAHENQPPLQGTIPDMTASTDLYVQLQRTYREQAEKDLAEFKSYLPDGSSVDDELVQTFCHNVYQIDLLQTRSIAQEWNEDAPDDDDEICQDLRMATMEGGEERPDQTPMLWYLGLQACRLFYQEHGRYPGATTSLLTTDEEHASDDDAVKLQTCIVQMVQRYKLQEVDLIKETLLKPHHHHQDDVASSSSAYALELVRYANAEVHTIASIVGGVASQEAVKLITGQYVPINNTYVYNGIASTGGVYKF